MDMYMSQAFVGFVTIVPLQLHGEQVYGLIGLEDNAYHPISVLTLEGPVPSTHHVVSLLEQWQSFCDSMYIHLWIIGQLLTHWGMEQNCHHSVLQVEFQIFFLDRKITHFDKNVIEF